MVPNNHRTPYNPSSTTVVITHGWEREISPDPDGQSLTLSGDFDDIPNVDIDLMVVVTQTPDTEPVPEPGTLLLFASGLVVWEGLKMMGRSVR